MKYWFVAILPLMFFSCADKDTISEGGEEDRLDIVNEITVSKGTRAYDTTGDESDNILTEENKFGDGSILYVSQLGTTGSINFPSGYNKESRVESNLYSYKWYDNPKAGWSSEYNFEPLKPEHVIKWENVKNMGNVGNAFSLYAMYFPVDQKIRFNVESDQTGGNEQPGDDPYDTKNFLKSDIMGAYHATSSLYTRLRFRLFHLMVYLKVTLYVPVYDSKLNNSQAEYSGYDYGAMQDAHVLNANTEFSIEWRANRSSDTEAPLTQPTGEKRNIKMYRHKEESDKTICLDVSKYYTGNFIGVCKCKREGGTPCDDCKCECCKEGANESTTCKCDEVRVYEFSVLFPAQNFDKNNILEFQLIDKDNNLRKFYFSGSQIIGGENANYGLTQGTLQHLYLYLPRATNETILVGAKILPWNNAFTDMTVTQEKSGENPEDNNK